MRPSEATPSSARFVTAFSDTMRESASVSGTFACANRHCSIARTVVAPIPVEGKVATRASATVSRAFTDSRSQAIASLISARSKNEVPPTSA